MPIKTIIGQAAQGKYFFPRPSITKQIWEKLSAGSNLLLVAPRRVGKSSILFHLKNRPKKNFIVVYYISESVNNENEFYKKLLKHIGDELSGVKKYTARAMATTKDFLSRFDKINVDGITLGESKLSYADEFKIFVNTLESQNETIVVLVDEFAQTVENIIRDQGDSAAIHFLETKREIRQLAGIHKKMLFVYAGSIGLENIVSKLNKINLINDLVDIPVHPLTKEEAIRLATKILGETKIHFQDDGFDYLAEKIEWLIPFYFQLILDEAYKILSEKKSSAITKEIIDKSINNSLKHKIYFDQWLQRLRVAFNGNDFTFVKELLNKIADNRTIHSNDIVNIATKYHLENDYPALINALKHDGYINNNDDPKIYRFNSPLLRMWWYDNVAN